MSRFLSLALAGLLRYADLPGLSNGPGPVNGWPQIAADPTREAHQPHRSGK